MVQMAKNKVNIQKETLENWPRPPNKLFATIIFKKKHNLKIFENLKLIKI